MYPLRSAYACPVGDCFRNKIVVYAEQHDQDQAKETEKRRLDYFSGSFDLKFDSEILFQTKTLLSGF